MNRNMLYGVVGVILIILILCAGCLDESAVEVKEEKKTYIIGFDGAYPPFAYTDNLGNNLGFDVESAYWIAEQKGFDITYQALAWSELIPALQNGRLDMVYAGMSITPERQEIIDFTNPYWTVNQGVAAYIESDVTMEDLYSGKATIAVERENSAHEWVQNNIANYEERVANRTILFYDSFAMSVIGVQKREADVVIFDDISLANYIEGRPMKIIGIIETNEQYGVAVRKGNTEVLEIMNEGLADLKASPKWQELIDKYIYVAE